MKKIVNNWYNISLGLAAVTALIAVFGTNDPMQRVLLAFATVLFLHFFEEFGYPGGFPLMGVQILLGSAEMDSTKWGSNNLNGMFGNWTTQLLVYILPLFLPGVRFLTMAAIVLSVMEVMMHMFIFIVKRKKIYNPGLITTMFGILPILCYYFVKVYDTSTYFWYDYVIAVIYFVIVFFFCFRSPLFWKLGKVEGFPLTERSAYGIR